MQIENFWNNLPSFSNNEKGKNGTFGYGYWKKKGRESSHLRNRKRKCLREIKKLGFDSSEAWELDNAIMRYLSDEFGGFFKQCGSTVFWTDYDLEGNKYDFWKHKDDKDWFEKNRAIETTRYNSYKEHLKDLLDNLSKEAFEDVAQFISPRLRHLAKIAHGWPATDEFPTYEDWIQELNNMADAFDNGTYTESFINNFYLLWD